MITRLGQLGTKLNEIIPNHDDMIIHTGSYQGEGKSIKDPTRYLKNIENTFKYLEQARKENKRFIYISTWDEASNPYIASKRACEKMVKQWSITYGIEFLIIQIPSIIGRGIIHAFINAKDKLIINDRYLEFATLDEVSETVKNCIEDPKNINKVIRVTGQKISVKLLYDLITYIKGRINENTN